MCLCKCGGNIIVLQCFLPFLTTSYALEMGILLQFCPGERKEVQGYDSKASFAGDLFTVTGVIDP